MNSMAILILAVIAGFLFYQLRSVLGQTPYDVHDRNKKKRHRAKETDHFQETGHGEQTIISPVSLTTNHKFIKGSTEEKTGITNTLNHIKDNYKDFQLIEFIDGSKAAYEMIINAFEKDNIDSIKSFVSEKIFNDFNILRQNYNEKKYKYTNAITNIESAMITSAKTTEHTAQITVEIKSQNVIALEDANGNTLHGDSKQIKTVTDTWTFERYYSSSSPAWVLISK